MSYFNSYWKLTPKIHYVFVLMGIVGLGMLFSMFPATDKVWGGYISTGIILYLAYRWEYIEVE